MRESEDLKITKELRQVFSRDSRRIEDLSRSTKIAIVVVVFLVVLIVVTNGTPIGSSPIASTRFGKIRGKWSRSAQNLPVANFLGIPYCEPPLGDLRFKSPRPWNRTWNVVRDGSRDSPICIQTDIHGNVRGEEDCLYLNVYVPMIPHNAEERGLLAVLVFVHGGAFNTGSSTNYEYPPDYLLDHGIILVTLNYRLSVLGFYSTSNPASPGNYGIKDIAMALKWIQKNIGDFGGDPRSVTLMGQSAGAAATHILALTKKSDGLFDKCVMQSGSALSPWALHSRKHIRSASITMAILMGCRDNGTNHVEDEYRNETTTTLESRVNVVEQDDPGDNDEETMRCMRSVDVTEMMRNAQYYHIWRKNPWCTFGPTIEDESDDAILTVHPMEAIKKQLFRDIPWIAGVVEDEGLVKTLGFYSDLAAQDMLTKNFEEHLPYLLEYQERVSNNSEFAAAIRDFYFDGNPADRLMHNITEVVGDAIITWPTYEAVRYHSQIMKSNIYFYLFSYEGTFTKTFASGIPVRYGISHEDDLNYLFPHFNNMYADQLLHNTENDWTMINIMTEMWTSFVKTGVPKAWRTTEWPDYREYGEFMRFGLGRSPDLSVERDFLPGRMEFWEELTNNLTESTTTMTTPPELQDFVIKNVSVSKGTERTNLVVFLTLATSFVITIDLL